jgi:hypothetical protein
MIEPASEEDRAAGPQPPRIFVGLKMASEIAGSLAGLAEQIESVPLRRVAENDIHLTLVPPWNETSLPHAVEKLRRALAGFEPFPLSFERLCYGPNHSRPRLLARIERKDGAMARRHPVDQRLSLAQPVRSVELFRSPPPGMRGYQVVASLPLGKPHPVGH